MILQKIANNYVSNVWSSGLEQRLNRSVFVAHYAKEKFGGKSAIVYGRNNDINNR